MCTHGEQVPRAGFPGIPFMQDVCMYVYVCTMYSTVCSSHAVYNDLFFPGVLHVLTVTKSLPIST